ncbi:MAG: hypothetical protein OEZ58_16555 [Gammaproteobacteria bacterium]|nr:hypothetical protein [Gammaproteobacteria bacterium]
MKLPLVIILILLLNACASTPEKQATKNLENIELQTIESGIQMLELAQQDTWTQFELAKLYYRSVAMKSNPDYMKKAFDLFQAVNSEKFRSAKHRRAEWLVYYGSLQTLKARDFPGPWIINNFTPVGWIRLYYVYRGIHHLNLATSIAPNHPVVRLIRANTFCYLPNVFAQRNKGLQDANILMLWLDEPKLNSEYQSLLQDQEFTLNAMSAAASCLASSDPQRSQHILQTIISLSPNSHHALIAKQRLAQQTAHGKQQ